MTVKFVEIFESALNSTTNGITHPSDQDCYYAGIFKMIQNGLTPAEFECLRNEFREVIKQTYPGIVEDIDSQLGSDFHAMYYGVSRSYVIAVLT